MRERAASIGATLPVESRPGAGTEVRVDWQATPAARVHGGTALIQTMAQPAQEGEALSAREREVLVALARGSATARLPRS